MGTERLDVLCCCDPGLILGTAPADSPLEKREWVDQDENTGIAFASHDDTGNKADLAKVPGFVGATVEMKGKKRGGKKPVKKTWKEKTWKKG